MVFKNILVANDGSEAAFRALELALALAREHGSELHMVCVEEIPYLPEFIEEVRETTASADRRFHDVIQRSQAMAVQEQIHLHTHVLAGHPVRDIVKLAADLGIALLVLGSRGHSALYERMIGSRADRIAQLAPCSVLIVK
ncbi:universal stress protein [Verrucomicrobium sp. 3C]|uniref:universal stress protein n=1 Tax=Verrucomicrobium sp. 3C TaxID=1134055 RepID=UPI0003775213|nr:universal stress protein [Verrucomicrobium sp. 3C]